MVLLVLTVGGDPAISRGAEAAPTAVMGREIDAAIAEASARFGLPTRLIRAVLWAESRGQAEAVSPKGAMGLMQLMPAAWREMRAELALGDDPFQVRDNVLAGTGYLRELYDRFGSPGYLAAYNAGSGRYQRHLDGVSPLPRETLNYVDDVARRASSLDAAIEPTKADWRGSGLFVEAPVEAAGKGSVFVSRNAEARR